jgi:hypothetical protein
MGSVQRLGSSVYCAASSQPLVLLHSPLIHRLAVAQKIYDCKYTQTHEAKEETHAIHMQEKGTQTGHYFSRCSEARKSFMAVLVSSLPFTLLVYNHLFRDLYTSCGTQGLRELAWRIQLSFNRVYEPS